MMKAGKILKEVEQKYGISPKEVLRIYSQNFYSEPDEIKLYMEKVPELSAADIFSTIIHIKNPKRSDRFVTEINQVTIKDKDGKIKSEPKNWIQFGGKWYDKGNWLRINSSFQSVEGLKRIYFVKNFILL